MSKEDLIQWLEAHQGPEWNEERERIIQENMDVAVEIIRDAIRSIAMDFHTAIEVAIAEGIDRELETAEEFPDAAEVLKRFGVK